MYSRQILFSLAAAVCSLLASCSGSGGQKYSEVKSAGALTPHNGKGMVLIYRTPGFVSSAYKPYIYANHELLSARLARGGFYSYEAAPGHLNVEYSKQLGDSTSKTKTQAVVGNVVIGALVAGPVGAAVGAGLASGIDKDQHRKVGLDIEVLPGHTHYVYMGGAGGDLKLATAEEAEDEIVQCHWLNPTKN